MRTNFFYKCPGLSLGRIEGPAYVIDPDSISYRIEFFGPDGAIVRVTTVYAMDDLDACDQGWRDLPEGADDFQITALDGSSHHLSKDDMVGAVGVSVGSLYEEEEQPPVTL